MAGEHLPSKRAFASHLGISVITIENAYSQLLAEGYICSMPRRGYYACKLPDAPVLPLASQGIDRDTDSVGLSAHDVNGQVELFDALSPSALEAARLWQSALRATLASEDEREIFSPAPAQGTARLRRAIAHHLRGTRGMNVDPNNIVIGAGAQLLDTMLVQLLGADKVYAVEDPGYLRLTRKTRHKAGRILMRRHQVKDIGPAFLQSAQVHALIIQRDMSYLAAHSRQGVCR